MPVDELVEAMIDHDAGHALTAMAHAVNAGHEPRAIVDALVRHLRNGFLALMAPELVQLSTHQVDDLAGWAQRLGPAALVKGIERFGEILVELRHAPDPRVLVEVALVQLTTAPPADADDVGALAARVAKLEQAAATGRPAATPAPVDPATGRTALGGRARRRRPPAAARRRRAAGRRQAAAAPAERGLGAVQEDAARAWPARCTPRSTSSGSTATPSRWSRRPPRTWPSASSTAPRSSRRGPARPGARSRSGSRSPRRPRRRRRRAPSPADDDDVDLDELVDAGQAPSTLDRLAEAFPGAELVEQDD